LKPVDLFRREWQTWRPILVFILLLGMVAIAFQSNSDDPVKNVVGFSCYVVFFSMLASPRLLSPLDTTRVDLVYYTVAIVGAAVLFISTSDEGERNDIDRDIAMLESERTALVSDISMSMYIEKNNDDIQLTIVKTIRDKLRVEAERWKDLRNSKLAACLDDSQNCDTFTMSDMSKKIEDLEQKLRNANSWEDVSELLGFIRRVEIDGVPLPKILEFLRDAEQPGTPIRKEMLAKAADAAASIQTKEEERGRIGTRRVASLVRWGREMIFEYWPYVIALLLGLKIARKDYFGNIGR
jgi:hypothetical protein